jgi:hypothetical protein
MLLLTETMCYLENPLLDSVCEIKHHPSVKEYYNSSTHHAAAKDTAGPLYSVVSQSGRIKSLAYIRGFARGMQARARASKCQRSTCDQVEEIHI